ncbi:MAG: hypothetical protein IPQ02_13125 [Saprospiraceae bacterium]|uniref:Uncharacterized protein n=1 Tax=Candidatus Defluviibacterium haderslevense TaxID=2981993 RepID=A0A9D7S9U8_9BACT|nr:hypothetical protein [Candidatus Defluviibacterium haderslevense]MBL0237516.1 hypothetical protein [Candidatus Defluviibacterium haderslevense]
MKQKIVYFAMIFGILFPSFKISSQQTIRDNINSLPTKDGTYPVFSDKGKTMTISVILQQGKIKSFVAFDIKGNALPIELIQGNIISNGGALAKPVSPAPKKKKPSKKPPPPPTEDYCEICVTFIDGKKVCEPIDCATIDSK